MENLRKKAVDTENYKRQTSSQAKTDAELVEACIQGEPHAWEELVVRFSPTIYGIARKRCGFPRETAEDVYQEVFRTIFEKLATLHDPQKLRGWIISIVWRKCFDTIKAEQRMGQIDDVPLDQLPSAHIAPDESMAKGEVETLLEEAIRSIPDPQGRAIIECRFYEGMSYKEMSEYLNLPIGSIGPILGRSLTYVKKFLERYGIDG